MGELDITEIFWTRSNRSRAQSGVGGEKIEKYTQKALYMW